MFGADSARNFMVYQVSAFQSSDAAARARVALGYQVRICSR